MRLWHTLLTLALIAPALPAVAGSTIDLNIYGLAWHPDRAQARAMGLDNEVNPGLGLHYRIRETEHDLWFFDAGFYKDSGRNLAKLAGPGYQRKLGARWRAGGALVAFHSDSYNRGKAFATPVPLVSYQLPAASINATFFPKVDGFNELASFGFYLSIPLQR